MSTPTFDNGADYARFRPTYPPELAQALADRVSSRGRAVDVGCGNGQLTVLLAPHFERVVGLDCSADQLAHAAEAPNVTYVRGSADTTGLPDRSADLVVAAQAAHWFDLPAFYAEVRRIGTAGAVVGLVSYGVPMLRDPLNGIFQRSYWQELHGFWAPQRRHVETGYADLPFAFAEQTFPSFSIRRRLTVEEFLSYVTTWSAYAKARREAGLAGFDALFERLRTRWPADVVKEVEWPIAVRLARVREP
ncbi:MAG: class I SAM-dependent methyltransferase [Myxococcota bacterium]